MIDVIDNTLLFMNKNIACYHSETLDEIRFVFEGKTNEIDSMFLSLPPKHELINFYFNYDGEFIDSKDIDEFKGNFGKQNEYLTSTLNVKIEILINKSLFFTLDNKIENKYFFLDIQSFYKEIQNLKWINDHKKLYIFIYKYDSKKDFSSNFIEITNYDNYRLMKEREISEVCIRKFELLNTLLDEKSLSSYSEYPLCWENNLEFISHEIVIKAINNLFLIIANKKIQPI